MLSGRKNKTRQLAGFCGANGTKENSKTMKSN
jgi:hypothetical protein